MKFKCFNTLIDHDSEICCCEVIIDRNELKQMNINTHYSGIIDLHIHKLSFKIISFTINIYLHRSITIKIFIFNKHIYNQL